jgi:hypothetical protein
MKRAQTTLASTGFEKYTKTTRRAQFLAEMAGRRSRGHAARITSLLKSRAAARGDRDRSYPIARWPAYGWRSEEFYVDKLEERSATLKERLTGAPG